MTKEGPIGIICAMDDEIEMYLDHIEDVEEIKWKIFTFYKGSFNGKNVVLVKSGVGKVFAAMIAQRLIDEFKVSRILFAGVGGSLNRKLKLGDVVVSTDSAHHDFDAQELAQRGHSVTVVPEKGQGILLLCGDISVQETKDFIKAARKAKARHVIFVSSRGASPHTTSRHLVTKYEEELIIRQSSIPYTILRPGVIIRRASKLGPAFPLPKCVGRRGLQPTYLDDLVGSIAAAAGTGPKNAIQEIPGPEKLTLSEFLCLGKNALQCSLGRLTIPKKW